MIRVEREENIQRELRALAVLWLKLLVEKKG